MHKWARSTGTDRNNLFFFISGATINSEQKFLRKLQCSIKQIPKEYLYQGMHMLCVLRLHQASQGSVHVLEYNDYV